MILDLELKIERLNDLIDILVQLNDGEYSECFDMGNWISIKKTQEMCETFLNANKFFDFDDFLYKSKVKSCDTFKCVIGNAVILDNKNNLKKYYNNTIDAFDYRTWGSDYFGISTNSFDFFRESGYNFNEFDFLFGSFYSEFDNSISGAIERIEYYVKIIKHGKEFCFSNCVEYYKKKERGNFYSELDYLYDLAYIDEAIRIK